MGDAYRKCGNSGCETLAVTTTPKAFSRNQLYAKPFQNIHVALGLHPQAVASRASEIEIFEKLIASTRFVGEVGLDATRAHYSSFEIQKKVFDKILKACFDIGGKILSIHSARCAKHVLDAIERSEVHKNCNVILHWFSATGPYPLTQAVQFFRATSGSMTVLNGFGFISPPRNEIQNKHY